MLVVGVWGTFAKSCFFRLSASTSSSPWDKCLPQCRCVTDHRSHRKQLCLRGWNSFTKAILRCEKLKSQGFGVFEGKRSISFVFSLKLMLHGQPVCKSSHTQKKKKKKRNKNMKKKVTSVRTFSLSFLSKQKLFLFSLKNINITTKHTFLSFKTRWNIFLDSSVSCSEKQHSPHTRLLNSLT